LDDQIKMAVMMRTLPEPLKSHLHMHASKLANYDDLRRVLDEWIRSQRGWMVKDTLPQVVSGGWQGQSDMDIGALTKGKGNSRARSTPAKATRAAESLANVTSLLTYEVSVQCRAPTAKLAVPLATIAARRATFAPTVLEDLLER